MTIVLYAHALHRPLLHLLIVSVVTVLVANDDYVFQVPFITYMWVWRMTLEAIALLVLPILAVVPKLRKPPFCEQRFRWDLSTAD